MSRSSPHPAAVPAGFSRACAVALVRAFGGRSAAATGPAVVPAHTAHGSIPHVRGRRSPPTSPRTPAATLRRQARRERPPGGHHQASWTPPTVEFAGRRVRLRRRVSRSPQTPLSIARGCVWQKGIGGEKRRLARLAADTEL